jgi:cyclohexyl-isocyanide hydratase
MSQPISVVMPVYDGVTQLDFTGPHQFLSRTPDLHVRVASLSGQSITADRITFSNLDDLAAIESCDVLLVPGGGGCIAAIENELFIKEVARLGATARYLTSVCSGSLILGAAGFLTGRRAACHWAWRDLLSVFGAIADDGRIVRDGNILSGGGVTAGIDFVLALIRGAARAARGGNGPTRPGICASTALQLRTPGHGAGRSIGGRERAHGVEPRSTTCTPRSLGHRPSCLRSQACETAGPF